LLSTQAKIQTNFSVPLDGELWFGRGSLAESIKACLYPNRVNWDNFKFIVFDAPDHPGLFEGKMMCCSLIYI
jgi:DNA ligase-1